MIKRQLQEIISTQIYGNKAIIILGARQVGKSTLLKELLSNHNDVLWLNGDDPDVRTIFSNMNSTRLRSIISNKKIVVIDEAQRITNIGINIKLITDQMEGIQVIATGSSSLMLSSSINEPLTGRKREYPMFPMTFSEMANHTSVLEEIRMIPHRMVFGYYPEVVSTPGDAKEILHELSESYLYKDILTLENIRHPDKLALLLRALAFQIGSQVSYNELSNMVGLDSKTVERYIDLLEKSYIIFRLGSYSKNLRNELKTGRKIYFWDLGIRNAVINNFTNIELRNDTGELWENFAITERIKKNRYARNFANSWFWRTQQQQEIDYIEEADGRLNAFEFKWNTKKANAKCPASFLTAYPGTAFSVITPNNIEDFLL